MKKWINVLVFIFILSITVGFFSKVMMDKNCIQKNRDFFRETQQYDVLFFGSSHMELFISPLDLWNEYGITSYNFGSPEEGIPITYQVIKNAVNINKPKIICVDMHMFNVEGNYSGDSKLHYALDAFPLNKTKLESICEMAESKEALLEMIFTIGKYHGRWKDLSEAALSDKEHYQKGNMSYGYWHTMKVTPFEQHELVSGENAIPEDSKDIIYINKIIDLCKENDIQLLFISTPYVCDENSQKNIHAAEKIAQRECIPYLNFVDMNSVIDMQIDMYDTGHVNQSGMHKVTKYLGSYITKNYLLENNKDNPNYSAWNNSYEEYKDLKKECFWMVDELQAILEMLHDEDLSCYVYVGENVNIENKEQIGNLIQNISRENLVVDSETGIKSEDIRPLSQMDDLLWNTNYMFTNQNEITELGGEAAVDCIKEKFPDIEFNADTMTVFVIDSTTGETLIVKEYKSDTECNDLFCSINPKYLL